MLHSHSTTTLRQIEALRRTLDRFGTTLTCNLLLNCDTPNLRDAALDQDALLDLVISLSQKLEAELIDRRTRPDALDQLDAELTAAKARSAPSRLGVFGLEFGGGEPWHSFTPGDDHPIAVGAPTEIAGLAASWDAERKAS